MDIALRAVPILVREIDRLEEILREAEKKYDHIADLFGKKRPPLEREGKKGDSKWKVWIDETNNRLYVELAGAIDYRFSKQSSNGILSVIPNLREGYHVILDITTMSRFEDRRVLFQMRKLLYNLYNGGVGKVILVVNPETKEINGLFETAAKDMEMSVQTAESIEKAEAMIVNVGRFLKA
ncbi:MAG: hypothetical protein ACOZF0_23120 [Thermodesulfobacteriota bacterium]